MMIRHSQSRMRGGRRGIAGAALLWILALAFVPAHGHGVAWSGESDEPASGSEHSEFEAELDCLLCHVAGTTALPSPAPAPAVRPAASDVPLLRAEHATSATLSLPGNARAPPTQG